LGGDVRKTHSMRQKGNYCGAEVAFATPSWRKRWFSGRRGTQKKEDKKEKGEETVMISPVLAEGASRLKRGRGGGGGGNGYEESGREGRSFQRRKGINIAPERWN